MNKYKDPKAFEAYRKKKKQQNKSPLVLRLTYNTGQADLNRLIEKAKNTILKDKRQVKWDLALKGREKYVYSFEDVQNRLYEMLSDHFVMGDIVRNRNFYRMIVNKVVSDK